MSARPGDVPAQPAESPLIHSAAWAGRTVLVTGGTSGTGFRAAERFLAGGANVVVNGRSAERGRAALDRLRSTSDRVTLHLGDCSSYDHAAAAVRQAVDGFGSLDVVVSAGASGVGDPKPFVNMTPDEIRDGLTSRYLARMYPVRAALPFLQQRPHACVVLLTTDAARHATRGASVIGAYAAGIIQLTKTLAHELSRDGVRVNGVAMTLTTDTRSWDAIRDEGSLNRDQFARFPFGRPPNATEVADAVVYLASPAAAQITGQVLSVNGGLSYGGW